MTPEIALVFILLSGVVILFATERVPVDIIALLALCVLIGAKILTPAEAFAGFGSELVVLLASVFVLGGALQFTGILQRLADGILAVAGGGTRRLTVLLMLATGGLSAFMNNTTVAAIMVPPVVGMARRAGVSASKLLMPLAFAAILGGTCTLIGTSTNIAVSGFLTAAGHEPLGFFEILPMGAILLAIGVGFSLLVGTRLLPSHENDVFSAPDPGREYFAEVAVLPGSPLAGEKAFAWELSLVGFRLIKIGRGDAAILPDAQTTIAVGDRLVVGGRIGNLRKVLVIEGLSFTAALRPAEVGEALPVAGVALGEAIVLRGSELVGATVRDLEFRQRYGLTVLAIHRGGSPIYEGVGDAILREADVLLLLGPSERFEALRRGGSLLQALGDGEAAGAPPLAARGWGALAIFVAAIAVGSSGLLPLAGAFLAGAIALVLTRCIPVEKARELIDWRLLVLVGGMMAFGTAMEKTGAADLLAGWMVTALSPFGFTVVLGGFLLLTVLLTQPMSNAAAALVVLPVAMSAAQALGVNERTFAIGVMLAASVSFIAPLEPACLLVYGAGKYRMTDFFKVGGLLTLILTAAILFLLPLLWELNP